MSKSNYEEKLINLDQEIVSLFEEKAMLMNEFILHDEDALIKILANQNLDRMLEDSLNMTKASGSKYSVEIAELVSKTADEYRNLAYKLIRHKALIDGLDNSLNEFYENVHSVGFIDVNNQDMRNLINNYFEKEVESYSFTSINDCIDDLYQRNIDYIVVPLSHKNSDILSKYLDLLIENPNIYLKDKFYCDQNGKRIKQFNELAIDTYYRYMILGFEKDFVDTSNTTDIIINTNNNDNKFEEIVSLFAKYDVKIIKIESTEIREDSVGIMFYVIFEGNLRDKKINELMSRLIHDMPYLRIIGSYKVD